MPSELGRGALASVTIVFEGAEFGGTIRLNVFAATGTHGTATGEFEIK